MDSEENEVESSSDAGPSGMEEPSESGMGMESSEAMSADSSDAAASHAQAPESDCHVGQSSEGLVVRFSECPLLEDNLNLINVSSVSTVTQSVLVSESAQVLVHSSAVSDGAMMVSDSTASTSSDLGSAIDKIIESTIGPDVMNGCIAVTSAEDGGAETTQYLLLQGPDDGAPMVAQMSSSAMSNRAAIEAHAEGPTSTCQDQGDPQGGLEPDQPDDHPGHSGYREENHQPNLAELEEMMEVVIVHQFKCKMCPYKSVSKDTLINHMRDKHFKPAARQKAEREEQPEEEVDDIVDAGAIDDPEEDSDYNPVDQEIKGRPPAFPRKPPTPISSSSQGRPRRKVGRPRKYNVSGEGNSSKEASSSGLGQGLGREINEDTAEAAISQSDSENKDPSSNSQPEEEFLPRKRGRPSKRFLRKKYRNRYYKSLKPLLRPHNCWICGSRFLTQEDLRFHIDSHEGNDPELFKCLQCSYRCKRWSSLKEHMFNHEGTKPFKCEECDYSSVYKKDVIRHSAVHTCLSFSFLQVPKVLEFPCPVCDKVYPMQKRLTQHMKTHSSEKPHMCDKVWSLFLSNSAFTSQSSVFKCEFCDYSCENKKLLLNHQLSHTNDRPFRCDYCKYSTSKEEFLVSHMAIKHTGEKPFSCDMCHFTTKHRKNLRLHVQCRHPEAFDEWSLAHPEEPVRRRRKPFFTLQQIEELKQQHDDNNPTLQNTIAMQGIENASVTQDALGNTTIIYEHAESSGLSAQNALDLLLNMSNAREIVGNSLQVAVLKSEGSEGEGGTVGALAVAPGQGQKIMTFHVSENGDAVLQEAYEAAASEAGELTHIAIGSYEDAGEFSVVEEPAGEVHSPAYRCLKTEWNTENICFLFLLSLHYSDKSTSSPNTKRFCCRICMESFNGRSDMENHKRAHLDSNTFKCPDCDFTSTAWPEVKSHMGMHSYLRPHKCPSCSFASKNKKDLRRHMMTHTNEKPFACKYCGQRFNRNGHLKFHMERLHSQDHPTRKSRSNASQQTIIVNSDEEALATLQSLQAHQTTITPERLQVLGQDHIIVSQEQPLSDQEEGSYIQQITTIDGQTVQHLMTGDNQVQYIISQDGVEHLIPQEYVVVSDGNQIQVIGQNYFKIYNKFCELLSRFSPSFLNNLKWDAIFLIIIINITFLLAAVADAAMGQTQTLYTEATPEQLEQLQQQGIPYDVITFTNE
uniref:Zinc finger protein 335 n=1 Tax=Xiphophorus couchianus TaxID=32473 RepID=A0A3B5LBP2_9TELE